MNIQTSQNYPARPAQFLDRSAELASRAGGLAAFGFCILSLLYLVAF
ncbi:MAG TPA: hypothetical protein VF463_18590 [Sphingobium sp.]